MVEQDQRQTRLESEHQRLIELSARSDLVDIEAMESTPPKRYRVAFRCKGLMLHPESGNPCVTVNHVMEIYLPTKYPTEPPYLRWMTPIFHPNISRNGSVCIGVADQDWAPSLSLAWLVEQIADMIAYKSYNIDDPWNKEAAEWARENAEKFPVDDRILFKPPETIAQKERPLSTAAPVEVKLQQADRKPHAAKTTTPDVSPKTRQTTIRVARVRTPKVNDK